MRSIELNLFAEQAFDENALKNTIAKELKIRKTDISAMQIIRRSIDSRRGRPVVRMKVDVYINEPFQISYEHDYQYDDVSSAPKVIVIGSGPAGLFAALRLIELHLCPIVLERGKEVGERKKDLAQLCRNNGLNPDSNYCFGEGGAGTFSDGKLHTRSTKRGNVRRILEIFHLHGAADSVLYESHPHIGTDKLPNIIKNMRNRIIDCGGEVHFETKVVDLLIDGDQIKGVKCANGDIYESDNVILATGHSARDVYYMLDNKQIALQEKGFALGVRVEHPQQLIDSAQYHCYDRGVLPAASYSLVTQVNGRGVYSFCMCPGGTMVPASTENNGIVVNGMSSSHRNSPFANSGIAVELRPEDFAQYSEKGALAGLYYQQSIEQMAYNNGGDGFIAPAQRLYDFVNGRLSNSLPKCSYPVGVVSSPLHFWMPEVISNSLRQGFRDFNHKIKGFLTNEAIIVGVESRTSSPVRIPRDNETLEHVSIKGLYPCGEGAGYAGGITSSAIDGERCAEMIANKINNI